MKTLLLKIASSVMILTISSHALAALPEPSNEFIYKLKESLVKVNTTTKSGGHGFGTGVAITKDHVVTNCHVIQNSNGISISK
jgi:serine protease Do